MIGVIPSATEILDAISGYRNPESSSSADRPNRLATVDTLYTGGMPKVKFDGESALSEKRYPCLGSYYPQPGDRVLLIPVGNSYAIANKVEIRSNSQGQAATPATTCMKVFAAAGDSNTFAANDNKKVNMTTDSYFGGGFTRINATDFETTQAGLYTGTVKVRTSGTGSGAWTIRIKIVNSLTTGTVYLNQLRDKDDVSGQQGDMATEDFWLPATTRVSFMLETSRGVSVLSGETGMWLRFLGR